MAKQQHAQKGQAGRKPTAGKRKPPKGNRASRLLLAALTFLNLSLTVLLHVLHRVEILHAVKSEEGAKVLLEANKKAGKTP